MIRSRALSFERHFERGVCVRVCACSHQCQRARPWQSGTSCACHCDSRAPHLPHKAEMTAERRVFKSVCLCRRVYQTITALANPLMDRLTHNSTCVCVVCANANKKTFKAERSMDPATGLNRSELSEWTAELRSDRAR